MKKAMPFIFSALILVVPIAFGIFFIASGYVVIPHGVLWAPLIMAVMSFLLAASDVIPTWVRSAITAVLLAVTIVGCLFMNMLFPHVQFKAYDGDKAVTRYSSSCTADIDEKYKNVNYYEYYVYTIIYQQKADTLICQYDDSDFAKKVEEINSEYEFYLNPVERDEADPNFTIDGFDFRLVKTKDYPHEMQFIGINSETKEIVYLSYEDGDLDSVGDFHDLLDTGCGWDYIRKERAK
ncbi:MAG: hypothetical protein NC122_01095 [Faecalibacterium sp.]|nr:hypothetical protein [Ruminococcus sp.]MCM1391242.1 hypothetical protein [Ruminococcus sp.]MCM1484784.1 hypothetical protein [Faecalibacterium sp.]